jgi:nicotinate phosphoribosyltransferase
MIIGHYEKMGIDPKTKIAVFSDGLNIAKAIELHNKFNDRIKCQFGIGTYLTNQTEAALPMVIKLVSFNGKPVAKISDSPGKCMCEDAKYLAELRSLFPYPDEDYGN